MKNFISPFKIQDILKILELDDIPDKETLKKHFKEQIKKYHPDVTRTTNAHEKTVLFIEAYRQLLENYHFYRKEYENQIAKIKSRKLKEWQKICIQVFTYNSIYLGLPIKGLKNFLSKREVMIKKQMNSFYLVYEGHLVPILGINTQVENSLRKEQFFCFVLYSDPEPFAMCFLHRIQYAYTIDIKNNSIQWDQNYGMIFYNGHPVYIPVIFRKDLDTNHAGLSSHS